jgi:hypothetical protein
MIGGASIAAKRPFTLEETASAFDRLRTHGHGRAWIKEWMPDRPPH